MKTMSLVRTLALIFTPLQLKGLFYKQCSNLAVTKQTTSVCNFVFNKHVRFTIFFVLICWGISLKFIACKYCAEITVEHGKKEKKSHLFHPRKMIMTMSNTFRQEKNYVRRRLNIFCKMEKQVLYRKVSMEML